LHFPLLPVVVGTGVVEQMIVAMMSYMFLVVDDVLVMLGLVKFVKRILFEMVSFEEICMLLL
jgi:hypothetical protein